MTVLFILSGALVAVGAVLYIHHRLTAGNAIDDEVPAGEVADGGEAAADQCCGMHISCEKDSLVAGIDPEVLYYDDEELDALAGQDPAAYTHEQREQLREVLVTLKPDEIAPWARSIAVRGIALPDDIRDELLMIVAEARASRTAVTTI